jgi:hypothetical protein
VAQYSSHLPFRTILNFEKSRNRRVSKYVMCVSGVYKKGWKHLGLSIERIRRRVRNEKKKYDFLKKMKFEIKRLLNDNT